VIEAGLRQSVLASIPQILDLLKDNKRPSARAVGAEIVAKLSKEGNLDFQRGVSLKGIAAQFCECIRVAIPRIGELLTDNNEYVRSAVVRALAKLSKQRDISVHSAVVSLKSMQLSSEGRLRPPSPRFSVC
jgi:HEAT repeat protein